MARTTAATTPLTLEAWVEKLIAEKIAAVVTASAISTPTGWSVQKAHETDSSRPPCAVVACERVAEAIHGTGLWEVAVAVDLRLTEKDTSYEESLFEQIEVACQRDTIAAVMAANSDDIVFVTGSVVFDRELARSLERKSEVSRMYAWRMFCGLPS